MKPVSELSFEEALRELESVVDKLERGDVALDASIALYERGAELKKHCEAQLARAQARIEQITLAENGTPTGTAPLDPE